jgi:multisubunit Na+/H+ antiporter MnhC subunit
MTWVEAVVLASIVVPVAITAWLTIVFLRGQKNDPDEQRLRRAQAEYEARRDRRERPRR